MGLLDHLETQLERQIPAQLQAALQQALDDYQPLCGHCRLAMHRHHRYARAIATSYGEVRLQIPASAAGSVAVWLAAWRCWATKCAASGFPKNRDATITLAARLIELRPRRKLGGLRQEYHLPVATEGTFDRAAVAAGRNAGTGRPADANPPGPY